MQPALRGLAAPSSLLLSDRVFGLVSVADEPGTVQIPAWMWPPPRACNDAPASAEPDTASLF